MGKTRDFFKEIRDTKGMFHAKMGTIKDRNGMDLKEAKDTKRWKEYTEELYKNDLHDPETMMVRSSRARHPGMPSQLGFRKHHYKQKLVEVMEFLLSYLKS